jgi:hypothetical protein
MIINNLFGLLILLCAMLKSSLTTLGVTPFCN